MIPNSEKMAFVGGDSKCSFLSSAAFRALIALRLRCGPMVTMRQAVPV